MLITLIRQVGSLEIGSAFKGLANAVTLNVASPWLTDHICRGYSAVAFLKFHPSDDLDYKAFKRPSVHTRLVGISTC